VQKQGKILKCDRCVYLFNDSLFLAQKKRDGKLIPKELFRLSEILMDEDTSRGLNTMKFGIRLKRKKDKDFVVIGFEDEDTREMWVRLIGITVQSAITDLAQKNPGSESKLTYGWSTQLHQGNLHYHVWESQESEARDLIEEGAEVNLKNNELLTPLHLAICAEKPVLAIVSLLMDAKADPGIKDKDGETSFHLALAKGMDDALQLLCRSDGANANAPNAAGVTPLETAVRLSNIDAVEMLLEAKADPMHLTNAGRSVAWLAVMVPARSPEILSLILEVGPEARKKMFAEVDQEGMSVFHRAAETGYYQGLTLMLGEYKDGANLRSKTTRETPLHSAARRNKRKAAEVLLAARAMPNTKDAKGNTPLHVGKGPNVNMMLVLHGARPGIPNAEGKQMRGASDLADAEAQWLAKTSRRRLDKVVVDGDNDWQQDNSSPTCPLCCDTFSMFKRRHHCRRCGTLVCGACSKKTIEQDPAASQKGARVCDMCFNELTMDNLHKFMVPKRPKKETKGQGASSPPQPEMPQKEPTKELTQEEKRLMKSKNIETSADKQTFENALRKKYGIDRKKEPKVDRKKKEPANDPKNQVNATQDQMAENLRLMNERGEMLKKTEDEAAEMADASKSLFSNAKALRKKMQG